MGKAEQHPNAPAVPYPTREGVNIRARSPTQMQFPPLTYFISLNISTAPQTHAAPDEHQRGAQARNMTYSISTSSISSANVLCWQSHTAVCATVYIKQAAQECF